jgi:activator of HSP90 ATPase
MCKTIKQKVKFKAPPETIYDLLADSQKHTAFTGAEAIIDTKAGGKFSTYSGHIQGINVELVPGKRIVQAWREDVFPEGIYSMATFNLNPTPSGGTELILTHRGVPADLIPKVEIEWRENYWAKMKAALTTD